jgi:hypothetical protein
MKALTRLFSAPKRDAKAHLLSSLKSSQVDKVYKKILSEIVYRVAHHNGNLWWELKREIFDSGFQLHYHWQEEFQPIAEQIIGSLDSTQQKVLIQEWRRKNPSAETQDSQILSIYVYLIIEQVVQRARSAAYRTIP